MAAKFGGFYQQTFRRFLFCGSWVSEKKKINKGRKQSDRETLTTIVMIFLVYSTVSYSKQRIVLQYHCLYYLLSVTSRIANLLVIKRPTIVMADKMMNECNKQT